MTTVVESCEATLRESACWLALAYDNNIKLERVKGIVSSWCLSAGHPLESLLHTPAPNDLVPVLTASEQQALVEAAKRVPAWQGELMRLEDQGIHLILRSHPGYPARLTRYLPERTQPLFVFVQGAASLLDLPALGVIGGVAEAGEAGDVHRELGTLAGEEGITVHAGTSAGMVRGALSSTGGTAIVTLPCGFSFRQPDDALDASLAEGKVALISPFHPHAPSTERRSAARQGLVAAMSACTLYFGDNGVGSGAETAIAAIENGCSVAVWQDGAGESSIQQNIDRVIEAGGIPLGDMIDVLDLFQALRGEEQRNHGSLPAVDPSAGGLCHDPEDPRVTLTLLAQAGRVPAKLAKRLGADEKQQTGATTYRTD